MNIVPKASEKIGLQLKQLKIARKLAKKKENEKMMKLYNKMLKEAQKLTLAK